MPRSDLLRAVTQATEDPKQDLDRVDACNSSQVERWLQEFGVKYSKLLDIPLKDINVNKSRNNQARPTALIPDNVDRFALQMAEGAVFPPVVGHIDAGKVVLIDGNHRDAAARKSRTTDTIKGYVLAEDTPSDTIYMMMVDANAHHGETPDEDWRVQQALHLIERGLSAEQACSAAAVRKGTLNRKIRENKAIDRARKLKVKGFMDLASGIARVDLASIELDNVFKQASECAAETGPMSSAEVKTFVREIKTAKTEQSQMKVVADTRERRQTQAKHQKAHGKRRGPINSIRLSLVTSIGKILKADPARIAAQAITADDRSELHTRCLEAAEHLLDIASAIEKKGSVTTRVRHD